jgi:hypothetical protein
MFSLFFFIYVLVLFVMITELIIKQLPCKLMDSNYSFETRPGRSTWDLTDPGLESGRVEEKIGERKIRRDPATRSKTRLRSVDFCFFTKTTSFLFKKKNWPGRPGDPEPDPCTGPGVKNMILIQTTLDFKWLWYYWIKTLYIHKSITKSKILLSVYLCTFLRHENFQK